MLPYNVLQFGDFFLSFLAIWTTILIVAEVNLRVLRLRCHREVHFLLHVVGMMVIAFGTEWDRFSILLFLVPFVSGLVVVAASWTGRCVYTRHCFPPVREWLLRLVPGTLCFLVAFMLFGLFESDSNYYLVHSAWHVLVGIALCLLLPFRANRPQVDSTHEPSGPCEPLLSPAPRLEDGSGTASTGSSPSSSSLTALPAPSSHAGKCNYCLVDAKYGSDALAALGDATTLTLGSAPEAHALEVTRVRSHLRRHSNSSLDDPERSPHRMMHVSSVSLIASPRPAAAEPKFPRRALSALLGAVRGTHSAQHRVHHSDPLILDPLGRQHCNH